MTAPLQSHPPVEVAIGQLPATEQSHAQISMRVLASHLPVPCVVVTQDTADITLSPDADAGFVHLHSAHGEARLERPIRLMPLSEALTGLIEGILAASGLAATAPVVAETPASAASPTIAPVETNAPAAPVTQTHAPLLDLLLGRRHAGPVEFGLRSGRSLLVDGRYATAHLSEPVAQMLSLLQDDAVERITAVAADDFARRTAKGSPLHPVSVEQVCWALPAAGESAATLARWHEDENARIALDTWPNLSAQADSLLWLGLLARLARRGDSIGQLRHAAIAAGIPAARARHGLSLLLAYRHARVTASGEATRPVVVQMPVRREAPTGLLGRLRSRLRALAA